MILVALFLGGTVGSIVNAKACEVNKGKCCGQCDTKE